jgi:hypothetical protein
MTTNPDTRQGNNGKIFLVLEINIMTTNPDTRQGNNGKIFLVLGFIFAAVYAIFSIFAMNDLWKCYVDQNIGFEMPFGDPAMFCNSGMMYMYVCLAAWACSLALFFVRIRIKRVTAWMLHAVVAVVLSLAGIIFLFSGRSGEMTFTDYIATRFYPFWALTLSGFFIVRVVAVLSSRKS